MSKNYLKALTSEQREVVLYGCVGDAVAPAEALLVVAGAGTGKTRTLAAFAAHRVKFGVDPSRILVLAFNVAAAHEIEQRISELVQVSTGSGRTRSPQCGTFHATALGFIWRYASRLGLDQNFTIQDRADSVLLMQSLLAPQRISNENGFPDAEECLKIHSLRVNSLRPFKVVLTDRFPKYVQFRHRLAEVFKAYDQSKRANNVVDFDDLLTFWDRLLKDDTIGNRIRALFDYVLVDEYQDTTPLQDRILRGLRPDGRGLVLVGDDDQCIYGFRGATPTHILGRGGRANVLKLTRSHRSTQPILDACNAVIAQSIRRTDKALWSKVKVGPRPKITIVRNEWAQARHIVARIVHSQAHGLPLREQAVLARTGEEMAQLEAELKRLSIPYRKVGGDHLFDRAGVKSVLAILRWRENPRDAVSGMLALQTVPGVDPATASRIFSRLNGRLDQKRLLARRPLLAKKSLWAAFIDALGSLNELPWHLQIPTVCRWIREHQPDVTLNSKTVRRLSKLALQHQARAGFLAAANLQQATGAACPRATVDHLTISTIHSAKGLEWTAVYIINAVDGCIPSRLAPCWEEERRLLFVGITRAKRQLELFVPKSLRSIGNRSIGLSRTPFIPKRMLPLFKQATL